MNETAKAYKHRATMYRRYFPFMGSVLDIGCGPDPIFPEGHLEVEGFDAKGSGATHEGDANFLDGLDPNSYDVVYSSHALEHMVDVRTALYHWAAVLKPDGIMIIVVPDFMFYEQGKWPSRFNGDHKQAFSVVDIGRPEGLPLHTVGDMITYGRELRLTLLEVKLELHGYNMAKFCNGEDQTLGNAMASICFVYRKTP